MTRVIAWTVTVIQIFLALRFLRRVARTLTGETIPLIPDAPSTERATVIVPVLDEVERIGPCLSSLSSQDSTVQEILVVDGGSTDGTRDTVERWAQRDGRIQLLEAGQVPDGWNGKAWNLETGLRSASAECKWILTIDADVRCRAGAVARVLSFAEKRDVPVLSIACRQVAPTAGLSLVHPSMLATLVYRFGAPGHVANRLDEVQSNGQFGLYRREVLEQVGGFHVSRNSICEDVTQARHLFLSGHNVGFYEGDDLAETEMYVSGAECLRNWPRSLSLRDQIAPMAGLSGLVNVLFLQAAPLLLTALAPPAVRGFPVLMLVNRLLLGTRLGILAGTRRAYSDARWSFWLSPLFDAVTAGAYAANMLKRRHFWRGRQLVSEAK